MKVRPYTSQQQVNLPGPTLAPSDDPGGRAIASVQQGLNQAAGMIADWRKKKQEEQDGLFVADLDRQFSDQERLFNSEEDKLEGSQAVGSFNRAMNFYKTTGGEFEGQLQNDNQRKLWVTKFNRRRETGLDYRAYREAQQLQVQKREGLKSSLFGISSDVSRFPNSLPYLEGLVKQYGETVDSVMVGHDNTILKQAGADDIYSKAFTVMMNQGQVDLAGELLSSIRDKVSPDVYKSIKREYDGEVRRKKAEEKADARESLGEIRQSMQDEEASVLSTGQRLRTDVLTQVRRAEEKGVLPKGTARDYDNRIKAAQDAHWIIAETKTEPIDKRIDLIKTRLAPQPGEPGFAEKQQRAQMATQYVIQDWKSLNADPMAYLQPDIKRRIDKAISEGKLNPEDTAGQARAAIEIGIAMQEQLGVPVQLLSDTQKDQMMRSFNQADPDQKIALAQEWESTFGDRFPQMLAEAKLDTGYSVAAQLSTVPKSLPLARVLMQVSGRKESDFETGEYKSTDIKKEVSAQFGDTGYGRVLVGLAASFPESAEITEYMNGMRTLLGKATMHYIETGMSKEDAAKRVVDQFNTLYGAFSDEDVGHVLFPVDSDSDAIERGLVAAREQAASQFDNERLSDIVLNGAIWRNDGDEFVLDFTDPLDKLLFMSGQSSGYVTDPKGVPIRLSVTEAENLGKGETTLENINSQIKDQLAPWRRLAQEQLAPEQTKPPEVQNLSEIVTRSAIKYDVPVSLIQAVIDTESGGNRWATSDQGARGLMQIIPETGARFGLYSAQDFYDPIKNVEAGTKYLKLLLDRYNGDTEKAIAAYHQGEATVDKGLEFVGPKGRNYMNVVVQRYREASQ